MGVYIKGMEMPAYCNVCPMQRTDNTGELTFCALTRKVTRWWMYDRYQSSEGHCPLIELPPHGRLIDADALMENAQYKGKHDIVTAYDIVAAPTIIEA